MMSGSLSVDMILLRRAFKLQNCKMDHDVTHCFHLLASTTTVLFSVSGVRSSLSGQIRVKRKGP